MRASELDHAFSRRAQPRFAGHHIVRFEYFRRAPAHQVAEQSFDEQIAPRRIVGAAIALSVERKQPARLRFGHRRCGPRRTMHKGTAHQFGFGRADRIAGKQRRDAAAGERGQILRRAFGALKNLSAAPQLLFRARPSWPSRVVSHYVVA